MQILTKSVTNNDLNDIIDFDNRYLINMLIELEIPKEQLPSSLTINDIEQAILRGDVLEWIVIDNELAGYYWFEFKPDYLYIAGLAIKPNFQGMGLLQRILRSAEEKADEHQLKSCRLLVIPLNGRAVNAYLKYGYKIITCNLASYFGPQYPHSYRFTMEKNLSFQENTGIAIDSREIICTDYELIKNLTDQGYVGVELIRSSNQHNKENKILFKTSPRRSSI